MKEVQDGRSCREAKLFAESLRWERDQLTSVVEVV